LSRCIVHACIHASDHYFVRESDKEEQGERKPRKKVGAKKVTLFIVVILLTIVLLFVFLQQSSLLYKKPPDFDIYEQIERLNSEKDEHDKYVIETMDWNVLKKQADAVGIVSIEMGSWDEFKESLRQHEIFVRELSLDDMHGIVWFINGPIFYYRYK
jgi:flagellar basal body-associated protein FliL